MNEPASNKAAQLEQLSDEVRNLDASPLFAYRQQNNYSAQKSNNLWDMWISC
ncbi:MAG: hypothetical protein M3Q45_08800 [Chloroflexota bacterium]|nr:hypothetical protein [Chloroflexota bacterium]